MQTSPARRVSAAQVLAPAALVLLSLPVLAAAPKKREPLGTGAIRAAEKAAGKKMSATQKSQIMAAARERETDIKKAREAAWKKFRLRVAKVAGISSARIQAKPKVAGSKSIKDNR